MWKGGVVASWLVRLSLDPVVQVQTLVGDIVFCSWGRHFTLTVPLSSQVYKWVPANLMLGASCFHAFRPDEPLDWYAD